MWKYLWAGFKGALLLIAIMYGMKYYGYAGDPGYLAVYYTVTVEVNVIFDHVMAGFLFALSGGLWGVLFVFISNPNAWKGMLYGLLPTLWLWVVVIPYSGGEFFGGFEQRALLQPLVLNCLIWGSYLGHSVSKR